MGQTEKEGIMNTKHSAPRIVVTGNARAVLHAGHVGSNIIFDQPLPKGSVASGFSANYGTYWGSLGHKRGKSLKGKPGFYKLKRELERKYANGR